MGCKANGSLWRGLLLGFVLVAGAGCFQKSGSDREIRIQLSTEPVTLDPALAEDGVALRILGNTREGLTGYTSEGRLEFRQAERVETSSDRRVYRFVLRPGLRWSDGKPLSARHFVAGLRRSLGPGSTSKLASLFDAVQFASEVRQGKVPAAQLGVEASPDDRTVILRLREPAPYLLDALSLPLALPIPDEAPESSGSPFPELAASNGRYRLVEHQLNRHYLLVPNPEYRDLSLTRGAFPVRLRVIADETTAVRLFETGDLDLLSKIPSMEVERLQKQGVVRVDPFHATCYLAFSVRSGALQDSRKRRAIAAAIRKDELLQALGTSERVANGFLPTGVEGALASGGRRSDATDLAAQKAVFSGLPRQELKLTIGSDSSSRNALILEKVQGDLFSGLGVQSEIHLLDWKSYLRQLSVSPPPVFRFAWMMPFADPILLLRVFVTGNPNNFGHFSDPIYDRLVAQIARMEKGEERAKLIRQAQLRLIEEQAALVPLYHYVQTSAVAPRLKGFRVSAFGTLEFSELRIE